MNRVRFPIFDLSEDRLAQFCRRFDRTRFDYVYGYASSLVMFARFLVRQGRTLRDRCPSLRLCISTAEMLDAGDRKVMEEAFGVPVVNEYGASETGIMGFEFPGGDWNLSVENLFFEVSESSHGRGQLLVTDMFNAAMPVIRYRVGDVARLTPGETGIWDRLECLEGRTNEMIVLPSGKVSPGLTFYYVSRGILEETGAIKEFIVRQVAPGRFVFEVVADRSLSSGELAQIQRQMDLYLEPGLQLEIVRVDRIDRPQSGKIRHFYSEIDWRSLAQRSCM